MRVKTENKYVKLIKELNSSDVLEGLLGFGLFPDKAPDFLTSEDYYQWFKREVFPSFNAKGNDYIRYESLRDTNSPRLMGIPNPFVYANLCTLISKKWDKIQNHLITNTKDQKHKISRLHIRKLEDKKHLFEMNYQNGEKDGYPESEIMIGKRFCVEVDISNCFPSIYSHSIPWALIGKTVAKTGLTGKNKWIDKLDINLRNTKNKETNGILIGPHTSNLISEIILVNVDNKLYSKGYKYVRYIDDYKCFVDTLEEAEKFILDVSLSLKEYELSLNDKKTKISQLPQSTVSDWVNKLNNFYVGNTYTDGDNKKLIFKLKRLKSFIDLAVELMLENKTSTPLNYAFKMISSKHLGADATSYYINQTHHLLLLYPYLSRIMENYVFNPFEVRVSRIKKIATELYQVGVSKRMFEASIYSIYWALKYDFRIRKKIYIDAINSEDCIFMLLAYLYAKKQEDIEGIEQLVTKAEELKDIDIDRYWLFVYEVLNKDKLSEDFKRIKKAKISFIKSEFQ